MVSLQKEPPYPQVKARAKFQEAKVRVWARVRARARVKQLGHTWKGGVEQVPEEELELLLELLELPDTAVEEA